MGARGIREQPTAWPPTGDLLVAHIPVGMLGVRRTLEIASVAAHAITILRSRTRHELEETRISGAFHDTQRPSKRFSGVSKRHRRLQGARTHTKRTIDNAGAWFEAELTQTASLVHSMTLNDLQNAFLASPNDTGCFRVATHTPRAEIGTGRHHPSKPWPTRNRRKQHLW